MTLLPGLLTSIALLVGACSSSPDRPTPSPREAQDDQAPTVRPLARAAGIDARHPTRPAAIAPAVVPVDLPKNARESRSLTTRFSTTPGVSCQLEVDYERSDEITRLAPATADTRGMVSWTWRPRARGPAELHVVCSGGQQFTTQIEIA